MDISPTKPSAMERFRIFYVKKIKEGPSAGDISHIAGINELGKKWSVSVEEAIEGMNARIWEFYVMENFEEIPVHICALSGSETFLSAKGMGYLHNLLEDLPECDLVFQL